MLHENSRDITSFATHKGVYRYKRLIYGVNSWFEQFQRIIEEILADCQGAKNIIDDVIISDTNPGHHDSRLDKVLDIIQKMALKINPKKCVFSVSKLTFAGHKISVKRISADPKNIDTIQKIKTSSSASSSDVKWFLGMKNYRHQYIRDYSTISTPLRLLTKKNQPFVWKQEQQDAFEKLKSSLNSHVIMVFYNPNAITHLVVDASPVRSGAILAQQ